MRCVRRVGRMESWGRLTGTRGACFPCARLSSSPLLLILLPLLPLPTSHVKLLGQVRQLPQPSMSGSCGLSSGRPVKSS